MKKLYRLTLISLLTLTAFVSSGCKKEGLDLPPLSEYQESEGWYEDAFVRVYNSDIADEGVEKIFTHPWFVLKPANSDSVVVLQLIKTDKDPEEACDPFNPRDYQGEDFQACGHVVLRGLPAWADISDLEKAYFNNEIPVYIRGELRGVEAEDSVDFILDESKFYACRFEYQYVLHNSNTFAEVMLENSGLREAIEAGGSEINLGTSAWGKDSWKDCQYEF